MKKTKTFLILIAMAMLLHNLSGQNKAELDDYPVKNAMFYNTSEIKVGTTVSSSDWFTNDLSKETLVFELYTDYHRLLTYHFLNEEVTESFILEIPIHLAAKYAKLKEDKEKLKYFSGYIDKAKRISQLYFCSLKGFKLGDSKEKALKEYGKPTNISQKGQILIYNWKMPHYSSVTMYIKYGQIIGIIICREMI